MGAGGAAGSANFSNVTFEVDLNSSLAMIAEKVATGRFLYDVVFEFYTIESDGKMMFRYSITHSIAIITTYSVQHVLGNWEDQRVFVSLNFNDITWDFTDGPGTDFGWDVAGNQTLN